MRTVPAGALGADDDRADGARGLGPVPRWVHVADVRGVTAPLQDGCEEAPDEPSAEHEHVAARDALGAA